MNTRFTIDEEHPLALELKSLRATVLRYQHEASSAAIKLQRHSLDTTYTLERAQALERENSHLVEEVTVLRAHPDVTPQPAALQISEFTNALRHVSDKLTATEEMLLERSVQLANASSELTRAKAQLEASQGSALRARSREEECLSRQRHLEESLRASREDGKMADLVIQEYADLVRSLTNKSPVTSPHDPSFATGKESCRSSITLIDSLSEGKFGLRKLLEEFNTATDKLEAEIFRLNSEMTILQTKYQAERDAADRDRVQLAELQVALDKLRADDHTATKMVSRYMKFSQNSNNSLSTALENLKARHGATTATLTAQIDYLQSSLLNEKRDSEKLRLALDELSEDISREMYGRRREISLRMALLGREEYLAESLRRWHRKTSESYQRAAASEDVQHVLDAFQLVVEGSNVLLDALNGQSTLENDSPASLARILVAQDTVNTMVQELQTETDKRLVLERRFAHTQEAPPLLPVRAQVEHVRIDTSIQTSPVQSPSSPVDESEACEALNTEISHADDHMSFAAATNTSQESQPSTAPTESSGHGNSPRPAVVTAPVPVTSNENVNSPIILHDSSSLRGPNESPSDATVMPDDSSSASSTDYQEKLQRSLLDELAKVKTRYDALQRAFRNCHLALKDLSMSLNSAPQSDTVNLVRIAVERLDDFNEDARVELEIRVADEERTTIAFETLLHVRGAMGGVEEAEAVEPDIRAFVDGTDKSVARTIQQFSRKVDDLTHDIASIKSFIHEPSFLDHSSSQSRSPTPWSSLAGILGTSSRPVSPAPTFGSVMTSPRLRHASSFTKTSLGDVQDPLTALNLRIHVPSPTRTSPSTFKYPYPRPRTTSMMNTLGFGSRISLLSSPNVTPPSSRKASLAYPFADDDGPRGEDDIQEDVE